MALVSETVLQPCLDHVRDRASLVAERVFDRLYRDHPQAKSVFEQIDQPTRQRMVLSALAVMADYSRRPGQVGGYVCRLGRRHFDYGARAEHFNAFASALMLTMAEFCGELWTDQVAIAWRQAANRTKTAMVRAADQMAGVGIAG